MGLAAPETRPPVLSAGVVKSVDEYLRFRHVVRNVYTFEFDPQRIAILVQRLRGILGQVRSELLGFAAFLEALASEEAS